MKRIIAIIFMAAASHFALMYLTPMSENDSLRSTTL
jgi:hypothetical protein